jgi:hypothetical protein
MMVKFLEKCIPKDKSGRAFEKDSIHELTGDAARHWLSRGKAEFVLAPKPVKTIAAEPAPEPPSVPETKVTVTFPDEVKEIDGEKAVEAFTTGQRKYRRKKLADDEPDD